MPCGYDARMSNDRRPLDGQVALVTGGARGIGFAAAMRLAADGASVALVDADADAVERAGTRLEAEGHHVKALKGALADAQQKLAEKTS